MDVRRRCMYRKKHGQSYYTNRHSCFLLTYHLVLVTKFRKPILINDVKDIVYNTVETVLKEKGINLIAMNGEADHLHILFEAGPEVQLLNLINVIKTKTARFARRDCPKILEEYYDKPYFWTDSYFVSTVGANKKIIDEYINNQ